MNMFGFNVEDVLNEQFEIFDCVIEVEVVGQVQVQQIQAPRMIIQQQFLQLVQQAANDSRSVRIKLSRQVECVNEWNGETKMREASIEFMNKRYVDNIDS